jgi:integrase/recombinase XerD
MKQAKILTKAEYRCVMHVIDAHRYALRNRTMFALSFYAGLRACEIAGLKVGDVYGEDGTVRNTLYLESEQTKGSEQQQVIVSKQLQKQLALYAKQYSTHTKQATAPLLFSGKGGGFSAQTVVNLFSRFYCKAGLKGASSHSGRRQFLTELGDKGVNARVIQVLARHKHLSTTQLYIDYNESKLRRAVELMEIS